MRIVVSRYSDSVSSRVPSSAGTEVSNNYDVVQRVNAAIGAALKKADQASAAVKKADSAPTENNAPGIVKPNRLP